MKRKTRQIQLSILCAGVVIILFSSAFPLWAAEAAPEWRSTYDTVMAWVNCTILFAVIIKYSRAPLKQFLKMQKDDVATEIKQVEQEKDKIAKKIEAAISHGEQSRERLKALKERIIAEGEKKRQRIVDDANRQGALLVDDAKRKIGNRIIAARDALKSEIVDLAIDNALKKLPEAMTDQDNQAFVTQYLDTVHVEQARDI